MKFVFALVASTIFLAGSSFQNAMARSDPGKSEQPLQLNSESVPMATPGPLNEYRLLQAGQTLYAAWTGMTERKEGELFVSEVDLERFEVVTRHRIRVSTGAPLSPLLALVEDELYLAWLQRLRNGKSSRYELRFGKVSDLVEEEGAYQSVDFGMQLYPLRVLSFEGGFLVFGLSKEKRGELPRARAFRFATSPRFEEIKSELLNRNARDVAAVAVNAKLFLFLLDGQALSVLTSQDRGESWRQGAEFEAQDAVFVRAVSYDARIELAWARTEPTGSRIWRAASDEGGNVWSSAFSGPEISGTNLEIDLTDAGGLGPVLDMRYRNSQTGCRRQELIPFREGASALGLDSFSPGCRVSLFPYVSGFGQCLVAVWPAPRGREGKVLWAASRAPWTGWQHDTAEELVITTKSRKVAGFLRLFESSGHLYLSYFETGRYRGGMAPSMIPGDLYIRKLTRGELSILEHCGETAIP